MTNQVGYNEARQYDKNRMVYVKANGVHHNEYDCTP
jgi:hypothetical protein